MKYLLTLLIFASITQFIHGQISTPQKITPSTTIGKIAPMGTFTAELSYSVNEADASDTIYTLRFRNHKYTQIDSYENVRFSSEGNTVDELYKAFKSVFTEENKKNKDYLIHFTLGKDVVAISQAKSMGIISSMFLAKDAYVLLTEKQVNKLFGKN
jgi:hypothetical protein